MPEGGCEDGVRHGGATVKKVAVVLFVLVTLAYGGWRAWTGDYRSAHSVGEEIAATLEERGLPCGDILQRSDFNDVPVSFDCYDDGDFALRTFSGADAAASARQERLDRAIPGNGADSERLRYYLFGPRWSIVALVVNGDNRETMEEIQRVLGGDLRLLYLE